jgi:cardiolipin synthase
VGSTNLDPLSFLLAREANVTTTDARFAAMLYQRLDTLMNQDGQAIDPTSLAMRSHGQRTLDLLAFALMRAVLFVTGHRY